MPGASQPSAAGAPNGAAAAAAAAGTWSNQPRDRQGESGRGHNRLKILNATNLFGAVYLSAL